jgi:uncharacterized protein YchJ
MNPYNGEIVTGEPTETHPIKVDSVHLTAKQRRQLDNQGRTRLGPNQVYACGSGKKFKRCCMRDHPGYIEVKTRQKNI